MILLSELSHGPLISFYDWQDDVRRMSQVVVNGLLGNLQLSIHALFVTCVGISVPQGKAAAREVDADTVAFQKDIACGL